MPKVDTNTAENEMRVASSSTVTQTVKAAAAASYTQKTISSMFSKAPTRTVSSARKKVLEAQAEAKAESQSSAVSPPEPVPSGSTSQIKIPIQVTLDTLEKDTMDPTWYEALKSEFDKGYFKQLKKFLASEMASHTVFPAMENIYSWSRLTPLDKVKVVVIGQDPYHGVGQAHVLPPTVPPPSLKNIYKQLQSDFPSFIPPKTAGDLSPVASQGVLWLNSCLTVRAHKAASHAKKGWETFTTQVLKAVLQRKGAIQGVVFLAWGMPAQKTFDSLSIDKSKHLMLKSAHPSPLSANRGFFGNGHFKKTNEWLEQKYGKGAGIDWMVLSAKK
ncbi:uracil-DNA glycosylase [Coprinopsis cinerea okayama7|uniref:Uracil-DNA glycosylase n=1 Tax=Coprinopsis cinerea (strain Okayama-7 / 130 / ATCC MYA-4618 / FGSC 9003) TaxID=240176 RepID=A8N177_COPC7|nr:uracil-DNA glycosylase [Coprinopsis cinerea okayama7\|eukprot:XP_001828625.2 uracil-DNA glycosylase [Coprinopsis cinerea okayama7\